MAPIVRGRQFMLLFVVVYSIAFPWACMRHCAMQHVHATPQVQYVCEMHVLTHALDSSITSPSNVSFKPPILIQYTLATGIMMTIMMHLQSLTLRTRVYQSHVSDSPTLPPKLRWLRSNFA